MSTFWAQFSGIVLGSFFTLLGIWFTSFLSDSKKKKDKRSEILESFQLNVTVYYENITFMYSSENFSNFYTQLFNFPLPKHEELHKEEAQRWTSEITAAHQNVIKTKSEFNRLYMSYKINFKKDDVLKKLINDFLAKPDIKTAQYVGISNIDALVKIRDENSLLIKNEMKKTVVFKMNELLNYLDVIVSEMK